MLHLDEHETAMVAVVRDFVNRDVRPVVRELEQADEYPEQLIKQMKSLGIFGLAVPEKWGGLAVSARRYRRSSMIWNFSASPPNMTA